MPPYANLLSIKIENLLEGEALAIGGTKMFWLFMDKDIATQVLWDHEREEILAVLGEEEIDPRAWSTEALVERIKGSIEGREPRGEALVGEGFAFSHGAHQAFDVTLDEIEDWLDGVPLFDASTQVSGNAVRKLRGVIRFRWDEERRAILRVLGIDGDNVNRQTWFTVALVEEIKDCIDGQRLLSGGAQWLAGRRVERIVELDPHDPELKRAWASFPDPEADNSWEYLATELIEKHWVHIFLNLGTSARVPARSGWGP